MPQVRGILELQEPQGSPRSGSVAVVSGETQTEELGRGQAWRCPQPHASGETEVYVCSCQSSLHCVLQERAIKELETIIHLHSLE